MLMLIVLSDVFHYNIEVLSESHFHFVTQLHLSTIKTKIFSTIIARTAQAIAGVQGVVSMLAIIRAGDHTSSDAHSQHHTVYDERGMHHLRTEACKAYP